MLRFWLMGGAPWTPPWEFYITLGGAVVLTAVLFVLLFPLWSRSFLVGLVETTVFWVAAGVLLTVGALRRRAGMRISPTERARQRLQNPGRR